MSNNINWGKIYESTAWGSGVSDNSISWGKSYADLAGGGGDTFDTDYQAVLDQASSLGYTPPSAAQQTLQNTLVTDLKTAGVWDKLDVFYVFATDGDSDYATLNWKTPTSFQTTKVNSPTFTTNQGFAGDGSSAYLDTNWNPSTQGINYTQNDACFGVYRNNNINTSTRVMGQGYLSSLREQSTTIQPINSLFAGTSDSLNGGGIGLRILNRTTANDIAMIVDDTLETATSSSDAIINNNMGILYRGDTNFSLSEVSLALAGANLVTQRTDLYNAINTYLTSI